MLQLNNDSFEWQKGLTVKTLLDKLGHDDKFRSLQASGMIVILNNSLVCIESYKSTFIKDGDKIRIISPPSGG